MSRLILLLVLLICLGSCTSYHSKVYICTGKRAYAYHRSSECKWLKKCSHAIDELTLGEAAEVYHRRPCKPCYKL